MGYKIHFVSSSKVTQSSWFTSPTPTHLVADIICRRHASVLGDASRVRQSDILEVADDAPLYGARGLNDVGGCEHRSYSGQGETRGSRNLDAGWYLVSCKNYPHSIHFRYKLYSIVFFALQIWNVECGKRFFLFEKFTFQVANDDEEDFRNEVAELRRQQKVHQLSKGDDEEIRIVLEQNGYLHSVK